MVRLVVNSLPYPVSQTGFQFQYGAIGGLPPMSRVSRPVRYFNSSMVRLVALVNIYGTYESILFQFQYGAIGGGLD